MLAVVLGELRRNRRRVIAPGLAIVISVAFVTVSLGATAALKSFLYRSASARALLSDVVLTPTASNDRSADLPVDLPARVGAVPGVAHAEPVHEGAVRVRWADGDDLTLVTTVPADPRLRWMKATAGRLPSAAGEVAVDSGTAGELGVRPGATLPLTALAHSTAETEGTTDTERTAGSQATAGSQGAAGARPAPAPVTVRVVGIADLGPSGGTSGLRTLLATDASVSAWSGAPAGEVDVLVAPGADPRTVRDAVRQAAGPAVTARTGAEQADVDAAERTGGIELIGAVFLAFAGIALVVAMIVIANTFTGLLAQRTRSLALLRCVGATRRQVFRSVLVETTVIGVLAAAVGVATGVALVAAGLAVLGARVPQAAGLTPSFAWWMLAGPFAIGVLAAVLAALAPARRANRVAPLAALRPIQAGAARRLSWIRVAVGIVAALLGTAVLLLAIAMHEPGLGVLLGLFGGTMSMLGVLILGPVLVPAVLRVIGRPFQFRVPGRMAVGNAVRNPQRASATSVALLVGICLVTLISVGAQSSGALIHRQIDQQMPLDLAVTGPVDAVLPDAVRQQVLAAPGIAAAVALDGGTVRLPDGSPASAVSADPAAIAKVWRGRTVVASGVATVPENLFRRLGLRTGSRLELRPSSGTGAVVPVTVQQADVPSLVLAPADLARLAPSTGLRQLWVRAAPDADTSALRIDLRRAVQGVPGATVSGSIAQSADIEEQLRVVLLVISGLLGVAVVIAVVGIANTLALSVLERSRESAVQRALGMTRRQLRASLTLEALLLSVVGALLGVLLGIWFGWVGVQALFSGRFTDIPLVIPWGTVGEFVLGAAVAGVLASLLPSRRAARMSPTAALAAD